MFDFELLDRKGDSTKLEARLEQDPFNSRISSLLKAAFPMSSAEKPRIYLRMKSTNPEKLATAIENFISACVLYAGEHSELAEFKETINTMSIQVGHVGDNCIILFRLDQNEIGENFCHVIDNVIGVLRPLGLQLGGSISTAYTFKEVLKHVGSDSYTGGQENRR